jgi:DNA-binding NarL/FixJ family response regulator
VCHTVLIVDDHAGFRAGARALLTADGFDVVGEAADGEAALEAVRRLRPEVVLLDIQLPGLDGFEVAERLAGGPAVVLISSRGPEAFRRRLARSPARGFIAKAELSGPCLASLLD